jgi:malonate-semialdehyde dehydrogenase (acetylating)/methylmalonate-semialdehyde dehydrogenase
LPRSSAQRDCKSLIGGRWSSAAGATTVEVRSPYDDSPIATVAFSTPEDVTAMVAAAAEAQAAWAATPIKERVRPLRRFYDLVTRFAADLAETVAAESGKTRAEALAGVERGLEVVDFALGLPNLDPGGAQEVSRGVTCEIRREPLGVVVGVTPFNFPAMVPMWMFPIAVTLGNAFILKPSEKVPVSACRLGEWMVEAGFAAGLFSIAHGGRDTVNALCDHPDIRAIGFVGSTTVAGAVYARATSHGKRALCLGGAKNHLVVAPDADDALTVRGVVDSFTGCAGQRCMAGSVLVAVGDGARLIEPIVRAAGELELGKTLGAIIDAGARARIVKAIAAAEDGGGRLLLDGRRASPPPGLEGGHWLGATVIDHARPGMPCATDEIFGPVLTVLRVDTIDEALALERASPYGNAIGLFTASGATARYVADKSTSGMVGINVGVPVPREPFSFGGTKASRFGQGDITGPGGVELWSHAKKITTRWAPSRDANWMS